jgi:hypothetical protein
MTLIDLWGPDALIATYEAEQQAANRLLQFVTTKHWLVRPSFAPSVCLIE